MLGYNSHSILHFYRYLIMLLSQYRRMMTLLNRQVEGTVRPQRDVEEEASLIAEFERTPREEVALLAESARQAELAEDMAREMALARQAELARQEEMARQAELALSPRSSFAPAASFQQVGELSDELEREIAVLSPRGGFFSEEAPPTPSFGFSDGELAEQIRSMNSPRLA